MSLQLGRRAYNREGDKHNQRLKLVAAYVLI